MTMLKWWVSHMLMSLFMGSAEEIWSHGREPTYLPTTSSSSDVQVGVELIKTDLFLSLSLRLYLTNISDDDWFEPLFVFLIV